MRGREILSGYVMEDDDRGAEYRPCEDYHKAQNNTDIRDGCRIFLPNLNRLNC